MKYLSAAFITLAVYASPAHATTEDMLAAALKRIEALESKTDRLAEENKQLRSQLHKTSETAPKEQVKYTHTKTAVSAPASDNSNELLSISDNIQPVKEINWQGIYTGVNAGYGRNLINTYYQNVDAGTLSSYLLNLNGPGGSSRTTGIGYGSSSFIVEGPVLGGQVGYNHQFKNNLVIGAEADLDYADINNQTGTANTSNISATKTFGSYSNSNAITIINQNSRIGLDWLGTARLRAGYALGNFMPYITAGFSYGGLSSNSLNGILFNSSGSSSYGGTNYTNSSNTNAAAASSVSSIQVGWAAGAGGELFVARDWSIKGEYIYTSIGGIKVSGPGTTSNSYTYTDDQNPGLRIQNNSNNNISNISSFIGPFGIHQVRVGLNYHTDWLASKPAMTAKY